MRKAVERALSSGLDAARDAVQAKVIELLQTYKKELGGGNMGGGGLQFPANLRGLPMLFLGLMKNVSFPLMAQFRISHTCTDIFHSSACANQPRFPPTSVPQLCAFSPPFPYPY